MRKWSSTETIQQAGQVPVGIIAPNMPQVELSVTATRDQVKEPIVWRLSRNFDVQVNIKKATVDSDFGWLELELDGPVEEIQRATAWLMTVGVHVEAQQRAVGA